MRRAAIVAVTLTALALVAAAAFWGYIRSERTRCYAQFGSRAAAQRAARLGAEAGFDEVEVEPAGPSARRPTSQGARAIATDFTDPETGADAAALRQSFDQIVESNGGTGAGCVERSARE
jgi:hypothetical protein